MTFCYKSNDQTAYRRGKAATISQLDDGRNIN